MGGPVYGYSWGRSGESEESEESHEQGADEVLVCLGFEGIYSVVGEFGFFGEEAVDAGTAG